MSSSNNTYKVSVLRADGWEVIAERSKIAAAEKIYDGYATGQTEPRDYAAVRLETPAGKIAKETFVENLNLILTEAQTDALAMMNGDGDLLAELAAMAAEQAQKAIDSRPVRKARGTGAPRGSNDGKTGSRYYRATHYRPNAESTDLVPFNAAETEIRFCTGTVYVIAHRLDGAWIVLDYQLLKKADAPAAFAKARTDGVTEEVCVRRADGKIVYQWDRGAALVAA